MEVRSSTSTPDPDPVIENVADIFDEGGESGGSGPGVGLFMVEHLPFHPTSRVDENSCSATEVAESHVPA
jgi:hypothetical protein